MFKPALVSVDQFKNKQETVSESTVNNVFKVLHGYYGNLFLSKYASGVLDDRKRDMGVASARTVWANCLTLHDDSVVITALERCKTEHPEFPPSLPQFEALCKACAPRQVYQHPVAIPMSPEVRAQRSKAAREAALMGITQLPEKQTSLTGLQVLKQLIAQAVGLAGGDEAKTLMRLDRQFAGAVV